MVERHFIVSVSQAGIQPAQRPGQMDEPAVRFLPGQSHPVPAYRVHDRRASTRFFLHIVVFKRTGAQARTVELVVDSAGNGGSCVKPGSLGVFLLSGITTPILPVADDQKGK